MPQGEQATTFTAAVCPTSNRTHGPRCVAPGMAARVGTVSGQPLQHLGGCGLHDG